MFKEIVFVTEFVMLLLMILYCLGRLLLDSILIKLLPGHVVVVVVVVVVAVVVVVVVVVNEIVMFREIVVGFYSHLRTSRADGK